MAELSQQSQEVFWAFNRNFEWIEDGVPGPQFKALAAAIEALADQVVPKEQAPPMLRSPELERLCQRQHTRSQILAIAAELRG